MSKEDLMIGDWVNLNFDVDYKTGESIYAPVQITGINKDGTVDVNFTYDKSESMQDGWDMKLVEPIPIIPKILTEKLGFVVQNEKDLIYNLRIEDERLLFPDNVKMQAIVKTHYKEHPKGQYEFTWILDCPWIESLKLQYIHELQHALKLCGIEKELVL